MIWRPQWLISWPKFRCIVESIEERRAAAKRKLAEAKEAVAAKQDASANAAAKLRQEAPIGRPQGGPAQQSPKERARELAEKAAAEKAARLAAQRRLRDETSIASRREERMAAAPDQAAAGAAWQPSQERQEAIQAKLTAAANSTVSQRLLHAHYNGGNDDGVQRASAVSQLRAEDPQLASAYEYLDQKWRSPAVSGALLTLERYWQIHFGRVIDCHVRALGLGDVARHYQGDCAAALDNIHNRLGYALGDLLGVPAPDFEIDGQKAVFHLTYNDWDNCLPDFIEDFKDVPLVFGNMRLSTLTYQYLVLFFSQAVLTMVENGCEVPYEAPAGLFPCELACAFKENMMNYYLPRALVPALFEQQPVRAFAVREAVWLRQRGWGQH